MDFLDQRDQHNPVSAERQWKIVADMLRERERQEQLKASGRFKYTCADPELIDTQRLAILMEEVGEVSRAILNRIGLSTDKPYAGDTLGSWRDLRKELIQVMAVSLAWVEGMDTPHKTEETPGVDREKAPF